MKLLRKIVSKVRGTMDLDTMKKNGLTVGDDVFINFGCVIDPGWCWMIRIGSRVTFGPHVHVLAHDASTKREVGYLKVGEVVIGDDVFIGARSIIMPGVHIGNKVVIGAGSVVTHDVPDNSLAYGVPAKVASTYDAYMQKMQDLKNDAVLFDRSYTADAHITPEKKEEMKRKLAGGKIGFIK